MKKILYLCVFSLLLAGCSNKSSVFGDKRVAHIHVHYNDSTMSETNIGYDNENRLSTFTNTNTRGSRTYSFTIDSVRYDVDSMTMYDNANKRIFEYVIKQGLAINCYVTSPDEGNYTASFHYINGHLFAIHETRSLSFSNTPDTIIRITYDEKGNITSFKNKYLSTSITPSSDKNKDNLMLAPVNLDTYAPAFYAGILGLAPKQKTEAYTDSSDLKTSFSYSEADKTATITTTNTAGEKTTFSYDFK
ncbi:MAG: hypothetical protein ACK5MK_12650 [Dysgonomonas sp.]